MEKEIVNKPAEESVNPENKLHKSSKLFHALWIGFLFGILIFGVVAWLMNPERKLGFLIPMMIPVYFLYKLLKSK